MQQPGTTHEGPEKRDITIEDACPICDGALTLRFTGNQAWAWCGTCRLLSRPVVMPGPGGAALVHRPAMA